MSRAVMQQALDALIDVARDLATSQCAALYAALGDRSPHSHASARYDLGQIDGAIEALQAAMAQQDEPVAWLHQCNKRPDLRELSFMKDRPELSSKGYKPMALYASPQPAPAADATDWKAIARVQSAKLHVALNTPGATERLKTVMATPDWKGVQPAPVAQPLDRKHILQLAYPIRFEELTEREELSAVAFARAIERAHKIGGAR